MARTDSEIDSSENENDEALDARDDVAQDDEREEETVASNEPASASADDDARPEEDDESSDDESSDDESSDDEPAAAASSESADEERPRKGARKSDKGVKRFKDGTTAGARLAAAKAAKAARKAAKRGTEKKAEDPVAQVRESAIAKKAEKAGSWAKDNRNLVLGVLAVLLVGITAFAGWTYYRDQQAAAAAALLESALEIADADIVGEDAPTPTPRAGETPPPTFPTAQARAEAALEAYRQVLTQYPSSSAAPWARLGEARALFDLSRHADARTAYEQALNEGGWDPNVVWRALEGKAFTFEAEEQWAQAAQVYEELGRVEDGRFAPVAEYHSARMHLAQGQREQATETLRRLVEQLRAAEDDAAAQDFPYVLAQAQVRLRELDPSAAPPPPADPFGGLGGMGGMGGPGGDLSPEQLQELIRRLQQQRGGE